MKCTIGYTLSVFQSSFGYYIGAFDEGKPNCRISIEYYASKEEAQDALDNKTFNTRLAIENMYCNGWLGCLSTSND